MRSYEQGLILFIIEDESFLCNPNPNLSEENEESSYDRYLEYYHDNKQARVANRTSHLTINLI